MAKSKKSFAKIGDIWENSNLMNPESLSKEALNDLFNSKWISKILGTTFLFWDGFLTHFLEEKSYWSSKERVSVSFEKKSGSKSFVNVDQKK